MMASSLVGILCSTTSSKVANREPTTEASFLISLFGLLVSFNFPANHSLEDCTCNNRLIKHQEHPVAYVEQPGPPEQVK